MKIIDRTPYQDESGQISLLNRLQGTFKYGFSWYAEMQAQMVAVSLLNRAIEKGFTLIRNIELGTSGIVVPLILMGNSGIYVVNTTAAKGSYRARGDEWGTIVNDRFMPASDNPITSTARYAKVLQVFLERQGFKLPTPITPILIAADPGLHLESARPNIRILLRDAIDRFASELASGRPIFNGQQVGEFVDCILNPRAPRSKNNPEEAAVPQDAFSLRTPDESSDPSRMRSILNAPKSDALIETDSMLGGLSSEFGFAFEEEAAPSAVRKATKTESAPTVVRNTPSVPKSRKILGMTAVQLLTLSGIFICWVVVMIVAYVLFF